MDTRYKITLSNKNIYKEIEIPVELQEFHVGTEFGCEFRLYREDFFEPIELFFSKEEDTWSIRCSENLYFSFGDVRKLMFTELSHGDSLQLKYKSSEGEVFHIDFAIDFNDGSRKYERIISLDNTREVLIGSFENANICIKSDYSTNENIKLVREQNRYILNILESKFGVYHDGKPAANGAVINDGDFLSVADFFFYIKDSSIYSEIRPDYSINGLVYQDVPNPNDYPRFSRNTRIKTKLDDSKIEILDPPNKPEKPKNNIFMRLLPSLGMLMAAGLMAAMGGSRMIIFSGISGIMAIVTSILGIREANKEYKQKTEERIEKYNTYISKKRIEVAESREQELQDLQEMYISYDDEKERFDSFSPNLFDRMPEDEDYLCVRLGYGDRESLRQLDYKKQERLEIEDNLQEMPRKLYEEFKYISSAPIVCDFKSVNAVGVVGEEPYRFEILKTIVMDLVARQHFSNLKTIFVAEEKHKERIKWLRMMPYVYDEETGIRNIVCDDESKNAVFESLFRELSRREESKTFNENIVIFLYDEYGFTNHPLARFVEKAKELGVTFVFFGDSQADIPVGCGYIIAIKGQQYGELINAENKNEHSEFYYPSISNAQAESVASLLAPVYSQEVSLESSLVKNISLFELLNVIAVDDINLAARWNSTQAHKSMSAPIGVSTSGIINLDLHDKAHGPHGLVAGTTGSGKSEILQTYILAMATLFHPYEVGFVIIDFKGGGMANQFRELQHLMGAITNIDGKAINRSLKSIKAELQKRQRLFSEVEVNHIDRYIQKFKSGEARIPLPHLIIIVDEFAELKAEQPDFMKELISAARIGRSLGVHLILATQKPSGQVDDQIWSNSRFKLCLKVQDASDSNEVLKSPLAAEIKEPGRAYLQVGNNEIFELFQSAYSGAPERMDNANVKEFAIYEMLDSGKRAQVFAQKKSAESSETSRTQLDAIVQHVNDYCHDASIVKLPDICLPALPEVIDYVEEPRSDNEVIKANIGIYDDPDNQYQGTYSIDITGQNTMIIGSSQSGKTNLLQVIIRDLATRYTPEEVNIYIIDFASMVLRNFEGLNHVGGVVTSSEDEKLKNLFKLLFTEIETRKEKLLFVGVSSFAAYKEAGQTDLPQIVLMIDNLTALKEMYFEDDSDLLRLCREGASVGISVIIANPQTAGIGYKYLSNFGTRIALFCNDSSEYASLLDFCRERLEDIHGRALIDIEKRHLECQCYLAFEGKKEIDRIESIRVIISNNNAKHFGKASRSIPEVPSLLTFDYLERYYQVDKNTNQRPVIGIDYDTVEPLVIDLAKVGNFGVSGKNELGKNEFVYKFVRAVRNTRTSFRIAILDNINKEFEYMISEYPVLKYEYMPSKAFSVIEEVEGILAERYERLLNEEASREDEDIIILVINSIEAIKEICSNTSGLQKYQNIANIYNDMGICIIVNAFDNASISYTAPEILKDIRDERKIFFFDNLTNMKIIDIPYSELKGNKALRNGDCYYINNNEYRRVKLVQ